MLPESLAVFLGDLATFCGLLDRKTDPAALQIDVDDLHPELLAWCDDLLGKVDVVRRHLRDVHESFDAIAHLDKCTKGHKLCDPSVHELADAVVRGELLPGVDLRCLERQADPLFVQIDVEHLDRDLVTHCNDR